MALENTDFFPIYRSGDAAPIRKASITALLNKVGDVPVSIDDLSDVNTTGAEDGEMLHWNDANSVWVPVNEIDGGEYAS